MAESYPIDSLSDPQAKPVLEMPDTLTDLHVLSRRPKKSLSTVQRLKAQAYAEKNVPKKWR